MLWQYTEVLFILASLATILSFHRSIDRLGQLFFLFIGGMTWLIFGISLLKITFKWGGASAVVDYTYIASTESGFVFLFMLIGGGMFLIGLIRAFDFVYGPIVSNEGITGLIGDDME